MVKLNIEYSMNCSPQMLYSRISTASGLAEWFADDVAVKGNMYTFFWDKYSQTAEFSILKENQIVRFEWEDTEGDPYFEFKIIRHELTGDVALHVFDLVPEDEVDETKALWDKQISNLKRLIGS